MFKIALVLAVVTTASTPDKATEYYEYMQAPISYEEIYQQAIYNCPNRKSDKVDPVLIEKLIKIEMQYNVPPVMRGMLLAAACYESGYNPKAKGDHKFSRDKKTPMAIGTVSYTHLPLPTTPYV